MLTEGASYKWTYLLTYLLTYLFTCMQQLLCEINWSDCSRWICIFVQRLWAHRQVE